MNLLTNLDQSHSNLQPLKKPIKILSPDKHSVKITTEALEKIQQLKHKTSDFILRLVVEGGGCQGFQYKVESSKLDEVGASTRDTLLASDSGDPLVAFDSFTEFYLKDAKLDFKTGLLQSIFFIRDNPKVKGTCGCSKSFSTDDYYDGDEEMD